MDEKEEKVAIVCRQTDLSEEDARRKLAEFGDDPYAVVKDFLGAIPQTPPSTNKNTTKMIFKEIELFMGGISSERLKR